MRCDWGLLEDSCDPRFLVSEQATRVVSAFFIRSVRIPEYETIPCSITGWSKFEIIVLFGEKVFSTTAPERSFCMYPTRLVLIIMIRPRNEPSEEPSIRDTRTYLTNPSLIEKRIFCSMPACNDGTYVNIQRFADMVHTNRGRKLWLQVTRYRAMSKYSLQQECHYHDWRILRCAYFLNKRGLSATYRAWLLVGQGYG